MVAVGDAVITLTPEPVKDFAIRTFGENDKVALVVGTLVLLALYAVLIGLLSLRSRRLGAGRHPAVRRDRGLRRGHPAGRRHARRRAVAGGRGGRRSSPSTGCWCPLVGAPPRPRAHLPRSPGAEAT